MIELAKGFCVLVRLPGDVEERAFIFAESEAELEVRANALRGIPGWGVRVAPVSIVEKEPPG